MADRATSWTQRFPVQEEPLVSSKGRDRLTDPGDGTKAQANLSSKSKDQQQHDLENFMETAEREADELHGLRRGFYSGAGNKQVPRHHIDEDDLRQHRTTSYPHVHQPMRVHSLPLPGVKRERGARHKKSADFTPSLPEVDENSIDVQVPPPIESPTEAESEGDGDQAGDQPETLPFPLDDKAGGDVQSPIKPDTIHADDATQELFGEPQSAPIEERPEEPDEPLEKFFVGEGKDASEGSRTPIVDPGQFNPGFLDDMKRAVSFNLGGDEDNVPAHESVESPESQAGVSSEKTPSHKRDKSDKHAPTHHHKRRHHSLAATAIDWLSDRRRRGSEVVVGEVAPFPVEDADEAVQLPGADIAQMFSHRFDNPRGLRHRRHGQVKLGHIAKPHTKSAHDHTPHEIFVELSELHVGPDDDMVWREKARWIKYEEDLEEGSERWGKPHVSSLSFESLLELRKCIEKGSILLDLEVDDFPGIVTRVIDQAVTDELIDASLKGRTMAALLLKHTHVSSHIGLLGRKFSTGERSGSAVSLKTMIASRTLQNGRPLQNLRTQERRGSLPNAENENLTKKEPKMRRISVPERGSPKHLVSQKNSQSLPDAQVVKIDIDWDDKPQKLEKSASTTTNQDTAEKPRGSIGEANPAAMTRERAEMLKKLPKDAEAAAVMVGQVSFLNEPVIAFVRLAEGLSLGNLTEAPLAVRFLFVMIGPKKSTVDYFEVGRSISTLLSNSKFQGVAYRADGRNVLLIGLNEFLHDSMVLPPGAWDDETMLPAMRLLREKEKEKERRKRMLDHSGAGDAKPPEDPLRRTGRLFGGLVRDVKRRYALYLSDVRDALNLQCLATVFFLYFACLAPVIAFGGLLSEKTNRLIGVSESLVAAFGCGVLFALFSGQPLLILGASGPVLVFEESLYKFCSNADLDYLPFRCWTCIWMAVVGVIVVAMEGSFLVRFFTRFSQEIFGFLISLVFIYETFRKLATIFQKHPLRESYATIETNTTLTGNDTMVTKTVVLNQPNTALLSLILTISTFVLAYVLKDFRNKKFLGRTIRRAIGDFGVTIAIAIMVLIDLFVFDETYTQKLDVPDGFSPTDATQRGWFIVPISDGLPTWGVFAAVLPGLLAYVLIFIETEINSLIVNKPENKLKKPGGYHLDVFIMGLFALLCGFLGLPMISAPTVRCVAHVAALSVFSKNVAPGEKPKMEGVIEQRVTAFFVSLLIGVSVFMGPVLRYIPLAVLFGVFLYMGVAALRGIHLMDRIILLFVPVKYHPPVGYVRRVRTRRMHIYTIVQVVCLGILWAVKSTAAALAFPFFLILTIPLRRYGLPLYFTKKELDQLDGGGKESDGEDDDPDFADLPS